MWYDHGSKFEEKKTWMICVLTITPLQSTPNRYLYLARLGRKTATQLQIQFIFKTNKSMNVLIREKSQNQCFFFTIAFAKESCKFQILINLYIQKNLCGILIKISLLNRFGKRLERTFLTFFGDFSLDILTGTKCAKC